MAKRFNIYIPDDLYIWLKEYAERKSKEWNKVSMNQIIIEQLVNLKEKEDKKNG